MTDDGAAPADVRTADGAAGEDLLELGGSRPLQRARRGRLQVWARWPYLLAMIGAAAAVVTVTAGTDHGADLASPRTAGRNTQPASLPTPAVTVPPDDAELHAVPASDMRRVVASNTCRDGCIARFPSGSTVRGFTETFSALTVVAAGVVTGSTGRVVFLTAEGRVQPDSLVHLTVERTGRPDAATRVRYGSLDRSRTAVVTTTRGGWVIEAGLVSRGTTLPVDRARRWAQIVPLPGP